MRGGKTKPLLRALAGEALACPPWWLMRQAGRYLPEYRKLRARARDFVDFCLSPAMAAEATLQPLRRFGMDAAILFADILLLPMALGRRLEYREDGPVLDPIADAAGLAALRQTASAELDSVYETVRRVGLSLPETAALIGFAGAPWTVATYMVEGGASRDFRRVKAWAYGDPEGFAALIELLAEQTVGYLSGQIAAGAEAVQLFDSWAGILPEAEFERWAIAPTRHIATRLKQRHPGVPVIGFPRGAGVLYERYAKEAAVDAVGIDPFVPLGFARERLQRGVAVQGNLDPVRLLVGGPGLRQSVGEIRKAFAGGAFVFNLGHGVLPQTPPEHVAELGRLLRETAAA